MIVLVKQTALLESGDQISLKQGCLIPLYRLIDYGYKLVSDTPYDESIATRLEKEGVHIEQNYPGMPDAVISVLIDGEVGMLYKENSGKEAKVSDWKELLGLLIHPARTAEVVRKTNETDIKVFVNLDGEGKSTISTGLGFFDHMLEQIAKHGNLDMDLSCKGDLHIDEHHTIEDTAIALGDALYQAIGDKRGIERYASVLPMDETSAMVALDLSGRPYLVFEADFSREKVGDFPTEMTKHFFYSLAMATKSTLHIEVKGENDHHKIEAIFKGFAIALKNSVKRGKSNKIPSSKGIL